MKKYFAITVFIILIFNTLSYSQSSTNITTMTGVLVDNNDNPVVGNIFYNNNSSTSSNNNGTFSINAAYDSLTPPQLKLIIKPKQCVDSYTYYFYPDKKNFNIDTIKLKINTFNGHVINYNTNTYQNLKWVNDDSVRVDTFPIKNTGDLQFYIIDSTKQQFVQIVSGNTILYKNKETYHSNFTYNLVKDSLKTGLNTIQGGIIIPDSLTINHHNKVVFTSGKPSNGYSIYNRGKLIIEGKDDSLIVFDKLYKNDYNSVGLICIDTAAHSTNIKRLRVKDNYRVAIVGNNIKKLKVDSSEFLQNNANTASIDVSPAPIDDSGNSNSFTNNLFTNNNGINIGYNNYKGWINISNNHFICKNNAIRTYAKALVKCNKIESKNGIIAANDSTYITNNVILATDTTGNGIDCNTKFYEISNNYINGFRTGIQYIDYTNNSYTIRNNTIKNCFYGFSTYASSFISNNLKVENNIFTQNYYGLFSYSNPNPIQFSNNLLFNNILNEYNFGFGAIKNDSTDNYNNLYKNPRFEADTTPVLKSNSPALVHNNQKSEIGFRNSMSCMQQFYRNIYDTIYITGTVKNGSKIVSNALITAYNLDSNYVYHAISNNNGEYLLPSVALGKYKLKAKCNDCLYSTTFYPNKIDSVKSFTINLLGSAIQVDINMILTGIEYESKIETVIYPVPVENELFINTNVKIDKIEILNLLGQTIISTEKFNKSINVESLQNGVYLLKIHVGQNIQILKFEKLQY